MELGEKLYNGNLKKDHAYNNGTGVEIDTTNDDFGRPATRWTYKTSEIGTYGIEPDAVYTGKMTKDNLYDLLGKDVMNNYAAALPLRLPPARSMPTAPMSWPTPPPPPAAPARACSLRSTSTATPNW